MLRGGFTIAVISGVPVRMHWTFLILLAWVFGSRLLNGGSVADALMAMVLILAVFACIVAHEFGHILSARAFGIRTRDVLLLPIGGIASLERLPEKPWQELVVAVAGPLVNVVIAAALLPGLLWRANGGLLAALLNPADPGQGFVASLAAINVWLILFNMIPAFPMDGGRVLRALLAMGTSRITATRIAARVGQTLAVLMAILGLTAGLPMLLVLAIFVFLGAGAEAAGTEADELLRELRVSSIMLREFRILAEADTLQTVVDALLAQSQPDFPVTTDGTPSSPLVGLLARNDLIRGLSRDGPSGLVRASMRAPCPPLHPNHAARDAINALRSTDCPIIPVLDHGHLVGLITQDNLSEAMMVRGALRSARPRA